MPYAVIFWWVLDKAKRTIPYLRIAAIPPAPVVLGDPLGRLWYRTCRIALIPDHKISTLNDNADALRMSKRL